MCKGIGLTRVGVFESSFRGEAELNLYTEQVVWAGLAAWLVHCFELAVEQGFPPEHVIMVLYASTENSEIMKLMAEYGFFKQMKYHSTTSQYGTLTRAADVSERRNQVDGPAVSWWTTSKEANSSTNGRGTTPRPRSD